MLPVSGELWLPGQGMVDLEARKLDRAVNEYDERLFFGLLAGRPTIFVKMPHGEAPVPVLGFDRMPSPEYAVQRLGQVDAKKRGTEILDEMNRKNEALKAPFERAASEATGHVAEVAESFFHRRGTTPYHRSLAKSDPKQRG